MTFYQPSRKLPISALVVLLVVGIIGTVIFFSLKECRASGIFRSGKTSDATELYQVYPVKNAGNFYLLSLEGVFKTRIYERKGGITNRSGSTDVRLTMHDLKTGKEVSRLVLGDYHEAYTKILGVTGNIVWMYNSKEGLHNRSLSDFTILKTEQDIISANSDLAEGLAKADPYLGNLNELFAFDNTSNAIMVTTISGKSIWIDAGTFQIVDPSQHQSQITDIDDMVEEIIQQAKNGVTINMDELSSKIIQIAADLSAFSDIEHESDRVIGFDSCEYQFEGQTVRTIVKSNCPRPQEISNQKNNKDVTFIEPAFLSYYNTGSKQYMNPVFLDNNTYAVMHARSIGNNTDLQVSLMDAKNQKPYWTTKTGIILSNERSGYQVNGVFGNEDTMFVCINNQLFAINLNNGKILWKNTIGKGDYHEQLYYVGVAVQNGKKYFITANSYFTELSREGIFIHGRTDYKLQVIDALTGKTLKKTEVTDSKPEKLPYYMGMSNNQCWFYTKADGIHRRTLPDLKMTGSPFNELLKNAAIESGLVVTSRYDDAIENKYVAMDEKNNAAYFTTENGLHYQYDLVTGEISEITTPSDEQYENYMKENTHVSFYRTHLSYMYHHELFFPDGRSVEFADNNSTTAIMLNENKTDPNHSEARQTKTNQFIDGQFLANGISLNGAVTITDNYRTPLTTETNGNTFYILHKDKIAPDAHLVISKYDADNEKISWQLDATALLLTSAEITRIYTLDDQLIFIFKTHPDLDDFFTCASIDSKTGKVTWSYKF